MIYLDSSAFMKVVVVERESAALRTYLQDEDASLVSSALLRAEAVRAVRHVGADALGVTREALRRIDLIDIDDRVLDAAGSLGPEVLRTLDAIHVATAMQLGDDLTTIVSYDERMLAAARSLGLPTARPS